MRKKVLSLALILSMLLVGAAVAPMALAAQTVSARRGAGSGTIYVSKWVNKYRRKAK